LLGTYFARDASYAHEYTDVKLITNVTKHEDDSDGLSTPGSAATDSIDADAKCTEVRTAKTKNDTIVTETISLVDDDYEMTDKAAYSNDPKALSAADNSVSDYADGRKQLRVMVAARVFVGRYTCGHRTYRKPPPLDPTQPHSTSFDSCVNYIDDPTLFVIFDSSQCYPEYFITYCLTSE